MSSFYTPDRDPRWNYGGAKWRLSRSKIELFLECPRCFWLDNKLGTARPRGPGFTLNIAVDALLKKEFDAYRAKGTAHPLMARYGIAAVPFRHADLDRWRENFEGIEYRHPASGLLACGAVDDVWIDPAGELIVVDYKATSKDGDIKALEDSPWAAQYRRQLGVYQWLLQQNGFTVSKRGYFVYANARSDKEAFDSRLEFDVTIVPCDGDTTWMEATLVAIRQTLDSDIIPAAGTSCDFCQYRDAAGRKLRSYAMKAHA
ncbi:MAG TPA: PD-(D/E)XK nuclease family protein [Candidatus Paceibacterota bacterium]|nr:PD-(D/E)XK nuclease family protein [Candidatus Paceibacterota bacterium]